MNLLPFAAMGSKVGWYANKKFKRAPSWAKAAKSVPCLSCIADASMGRAVKHVSMREGVIAWSNHNDLVLDENHVDDLAYSLRAITAQLMNMKSQSRQIPRQWAAKFETLYAKLDVQQQETPQKKAAMEAIEDGDDDESDDCDIIIIEKLPVDLVSISDDSDNDTFDASKLFDSDDPVLRAILQKMRSAGKFPGRVRRVCFRLARWMSPVPRCLDLQRRMLATTNPRRRRSTEP